MVNKNFIAPFYLGDWCVLPEQCRLQNSESSQHLQPKLMEVLLFLAENHMKVVSSDDLINACWQGQPMTDNPIHKTVAQLRKALGDASDSPKYIKTIPRKGYVLIAKMSQDTSNNKQIEAYWRDQVPFMGGAAFQPHQQAIFFGRQQSIDDLLSHIEQIGQKDAYLLNVTGESGCGKSSFIQAGIIPLLLNPQKQFQFQFSQAIVWKLSAEDKVNDLLKLLHQHKVFDESYSLKTVQQQWQLHSNDLSKYLAINEAANKQRTVLFVDQIEQGFIHNSVDTDSERDMDNLLELIAVLNNSKQFFIILATREEAKRKLQNLAAYQNIATSCMDFILPDIRSVDFRQWIECTVQASGLFFEVNSDQHENLLGLMVDSIVRYRLSLTLVQMMLLQLYEQRDGSKLQYGSYQKIGGFKGLINQQAEAMFTSINKKNQHTIIDMFPQFLAFDSIINHEAKIRQIPWQQARTGLGLVLLNQLINHRFISSKRTEDQVVVGLAELSLPLFWSRMVNWVENNRNELLKQSEVQFLTARWQLNNKSSEYLMDRKDLSEVKVAKDAGYQLTRHQQKYIDTSEARVKTKQRTRRGFQIFGVLFGIATLGSVIFGFNKNNELNQTQGQLHTLIEFVTKTLTPQLKAKGQLALIEETHTKLLNVIKASNSDHPNRSLLISHAASLNTMGEISFNDRNLVQALSYFSQTENIIKQNGNNNNTELLAHLMLSQYWIGYLAFTDIDYTQAGVYWNAYLDTSLRLREIEPDNSEWQLEHSYALNNLGSLNEKMGRLKQATDYFSQSIVIKTALLNNDLNNMSLQADLADSLSWQGNIYRKQGSLNLALDAYQDSIELTQAMKTLKGKSNTKLHREVLAFHRMASLVLDMGDLNQAQKLADEALEKSLLLNELDRENNGFKAELVNLHLLNAKILRYYNDFDNSLNHIQKASKLIDYFKMNLAMTSRIALSFMQLKREQAMIFKHFGQINSAKTAIEEGLGTWADYDLSQKQKAQVSFALLHLNMAQILQQEKLILNQQPSNQTIKDHLDQAWQEIDYLLSQNPQDCELMAISLNIAHAKKDDDEHLELIQTLQQSEYRNPELYQSLVDAQLISFN